MKNCTYLLTLMLSVLLISCKDSKKAEESDIDAAKSSYSIEKNYVDTTVLRLKDFQKQVITNGKLRALKKSDIRFLASGELESVNVINGQSVKKDDVLATLNKTTAYIRYQQAELSLEKAYMDLIDNVIGFGYGSDTTKVPAEALENAKIRSGYVNALKTYRLSRIEYENLELRAPFAGKVANVKTKPHEMVSDVFCTIIDDSRFEVEFNVLESEILFIERGQPVKVSSIINPDTFFEGRVTQINPVIDNYGQINVKAEITNRNNRLMEGMNVKIIVEKTIRSQQVVPKSAVVIRDNQTVLFRYNPTTKRAMWTYCDVLMSNSDSHVVTATEAKNAQLNLGDAIIISGNLNLANDSNVEIKSNQ